MEDVQDLFKYGRHLHKNAADALCGLITTENSILKTEFMNQLQSREKGKEKRPN